MAIQARHFAAASAFLLAALCTIAPARAELEPDGLRRSETATGSALLVPDGARGRRPLLVLLPFTGGSAEDLLEGWYAESLPKQARKLGFMVLLPPAVGSVADYSTGAAWSATMARYERDLRADIAEAVARHQADPARVALAGYSMGGDLAWALIQRDPERYAGAFIMGSRASFRAGKALERLAQRRVRVQFFMGESESRDRMAGARAALDALQRAGVPQRYATAPGEHVWAPPRVLASAVRWVLGYEDAGAAAFAGQPAAAVATDAPAGKKVTTADIPARLPRCAWKPYLDKASGLYGYRDAGGKVVVKPRFTVAQSFGDDGLATIREGNWGVGYLTCEGRSFEVLYDGGPDAFQDDLVRIEEIEGGYGFVNRRGQVVLPPQYAFATPFCGGIARVGKGCSVERESESKRLETVECAAWRYIGRDGGARDAAEVAPRCVATLTEPGAVAGEDVDASEGDDDEEEEEEEEVEESEEGLEEEE